MARPPKTDRAAVASDTLTLRLTPEDRATLDALVAAAAAQLEETGLELSAAAYVRGLIRREARRMGAQQPVPTVAAAPPEKPAAAPVHDRRSKPRPDDKHVRALFARALSKGIQQKEISDLSGVSPSYISKWKNGKYGLSEETIGALASALDALLQPSLPSVSG